MGDIQMDVQSEFARIAVEAKDLYTREHEVNIWYESEKERLETLAYINRDYTNLSKDKAKLYDEKTERLSKLRLLILDNTEEFFGLLKNTCKANNS
jgi:hypothetical protein